jgi:DNA-binding transcriptional LysR family regulator
MPRRLPALNALKAFEAAARHESFTRAAQELCVTQGAVSHQVKALEEELGLKLFNRERQRLVITEAGRDYLAVLRRLRPDRARHRARRAAPELGRAHRQHLAGFRRQVAR